LGIVIEPVVNLTDPVDITVCPFKFNEPDIVTAPLLLMLRILDIVVESTFTNVCAPDPDTANLAGAAVLFANEL
jgi:hypothetical protein